MSLGPDKLALLEGAGELVRALKLRRLGNLLLALQRAATGQDSSAYTRHAGGLAATFRPARATSASASGPSLEPADFAQLLVDLYLTRRATEAALTGGATLDEHAAEDL